jgi:hypothetical protein
LAQQNDAGYAWRSYAIGGQIMGEFDDYDQWHLCQREFIAFLRKHKSDRTMPPQAQ